MKTLRAWRVEKLIGLRELARASGVTHVTIIQIEHGRQIPRLSTIRKLSRTLDIDAKEVTEFAKAIEQMGKAVALIESGPRTGYGPARVR